MPFHPRLTDHTGGSFNPSPWWTHGGPVREWEAADVAFSPLSLSPLAGYDVQTASSIFQDSAGTTPAVANNDPLGRLTDLTGNGRHLVQATAGKRPLLKTALYNSKPYAKGDGVDDLLAHLGAFITNTCEVWCQAYASLNSFPGPGSYLYPVWGQGTSQFPPCQLEFYNGFGSTAQNQLYGEGVGSLYLDGSAYVSGAVAGAQAHRTVGVTSGSSGAVTNTGLFVISLDPSGGSVFYGPEGIGELWAFANALTGADRTNMDAYMAARW